MHNTDRVVYVVTHDLHILRCVNVETLLEQAEERLRKYLSLLCSPAPKPLFALNMTTTLQILSYIDAIKLSLRYCTKSGDKQHFWRHNYYFPVFSFISQPF